MAIRIDDVSNLSWSGPDFRYGSSRAGHTQESVTRVDTMKVHVQGEMMNEEKRKIGGGVRRGIYPVGCKVVAKPPSFALHLNISTSAGSRPLIGHESGDE